MPEAIGRRSLAGIQIRLIKTGGRLVQHPRGLVVQLAEVMVTRVVPAGTLGRISELRLASEQPTSAALRMMMWMRLSKANGLPYRRDLGRRRRFWAFTLGEGVVTT
ncbi:MAG: hypothetical protein QF659_00475 [Dehalococcoidia bacterium]|nr:hypothetical protein [Dehalococcoidia bacterium]